ncbi:hypothetical protein BASA61_000721 [Batrachochytrium salamandrivorans]|nr:hypothetical protein BASA61_000721 [Batrachochytrium salamandrivorans]KAH9265359.1 hypothetical protein BASA84_001628 [Batrachochytrium salamandrivorans]
MIIISDSESVYRLFRSPTEVGRSRKLQDAAETMFENALFVIPGGDLWKRHRKLIQSAIGPAHLRFAVKVSKDATASLSAILNAGISGSDSSSFVVDFSQYMAFLSMDIVGQLSMRYEFKAVENSSTGIPNEGDSVVKDILSIFQRRLFIPPYMWRMFGVHNNNPFVKKTSECAIGLVRKIIQKRGSIPDDHLSTTTDEPMYMDILGKLLQDSDADQALNDMEIIFELVGLIIAGYETTANTLSFIMLALCQNPHIQDKVVAEINQVYDMLQGDINMDNMLQFQYLEWVIKEAQRCYTIVPQISRIAVKDIQVLGHNIKAGTMLLLSIHDIHHDARYWKDPYKFIPERWEESHAPGTFMPFSEGQFKCVGLKVAMIEVRTVMIHLLREFKFELAPDQNIDITTAATLGLKNGLRVKVTRRV